MDVTKLIATAEALGPVPLPPQVEGYEDEQDPMVKGSWEITTQTSADWALLRLAECEAEAERIEAQYQAAVDRLAKRRDELVARATRGQGYFRFKLEQWATKNRGSLLKGKAKSVNLLHGKVGWRSKGGKLAVVDKEALVSWLETPPGQAFARVKYEPDMKAIQAHSSTTGEIPPGMEYEPESDAFYATPEAPETALAKEQ